MGARLTTRFWADAYLARLRLHDIAAYVVAHGDDHAGDIVVKLATLDGQAQLFQRSYDLQADTRIWAQLAAGPEREIDETLARHRGRDPDLWVIEVEDRQGRHLLDDPSLAG